MLLQDLCPPPARFRPAIGIVSTQLSPTPQFAKIKRKNLSSARIAGMRYERKAHEYLKLIHPDSCASSPWITFTTRSSRGKPLWCQPDALLIDFRRGVIAVIEIKLKHTSDAWWQVRKLYTPVVSHLFRPGWKYVAIELVKVFDPHTKFPEKFRMLKNLTYATSSVPGEFYVHIWDGTF